MHLSNGFGRVVRRSGRKTNKEFTMVKLTTAFTVLFFSIGVASADEFVANLKKVEGNKITINKSTLDEKVADTTLTVPDKVKVIGKKAMVVDDGNGGFSIEFADAELADGLKNKVFSKTVRVRIKTDAKNNIVEIRVHQGLQGLLNDNDDGVDFFFEVPPVAIRSDLR
jgi:hypothetical protein